jgi:cyclopropane-fatty-acyl-phospholipid synthase
MCTASETVRLMVSDVEMLRVHYAYTLREWLRRCYAHRNDIEQLYDARFFRMWEFYLAGSAMMFETGAACNFQVQYIRDRRALPLTRDYMAEAEERYRAA